MKEKYGKKCKIDNALIISVVLMCYVFEFFVLNEKRSKILLLAS